MWQWVVSPEKAPDKAEEVEIDSNPARRLCERRKTRPRGSAQYTQRNRCEARHRPHRPRRKSPRRNEVPWAYETPGGTLLVKAHQELERLAIDRETAHFQQALSLRYAELVYYGLWFAPLREALDGFFNVAQQRVTGAVGLKL